MKCFSFKMWSKALTLCLVCMIALSGCRNKAQTATEDSDKGSLTFTDSLLADTTEYIGGGKSLNDIRFANFNDNDWLDNEYIRCLRKYLDDYNSGKIQNESLDSYKEKVKGKFVIAWAEPCYFGGLFLQITFIDYPDDVFSSWIYSGVDEVQEKVIDYEVRSFSLNEEKSGFTKAEILEIMEEHPELKLW